MVKVDSFVRRNQMSGYILMVSSIILKSEDGGIVGQA